MSILIAEDNPVTGRMLEVSLQKHGYSTFRGKTGKEALDQLQQHGAEIEMVITDIMMPEMDGLELVAAMKAQPKWESLPVLVATAAADVENVNRAAKLGCQHYLLKPINTAQLFQKVHEVLIEKKPVLRDRQEVLADLAIEPQALYLYLVKLLSNQAKSLLGRLSRALDPDSVAVLLSDACDLSEIATLVGAERLVFALGELASQKALGRRDDSNVPALREELRLVVAALEGAAASSPLPAGDPGPQARPAGQTISASAEPAKSAEP